MSSCSTTTKEATSQPNKRSAASFTLPQLKLLDYILLLVVGCFLGWLYYRSSIGIHYHWQWQKAFDLVFSSSQSNEIPYFFQGVFSTIRISLWGMLFAAIFGLLLALARRSSLLFLRLPANAYIQLVRNIPPLVFVFIFYFFISSQLVPLLGLNDLFRFYNGQENAFQSFLFGSSQLWENLFSGILCVGLIAAAYIAEVIRAGLDSIDNGQWEAADSLGLSKFDRFRFVIFPQAIAGIVPALAGQFISIVKDSSIISLISIQEITFVGSEMANSSGLIFEIWLLVGAVYLILCLSLSLLFSKLEKRSLRHLQR